MIILTDIQAQLLSEFIGNKIISSTNKIAIKMIKDICEGKCKSIARCENCGKLITPVAKCNECIKKN